MKRTCLAALLLLLPGFAWAQTPPPPAADRPAATAKPQTVPVTPAPAASAQPQVAPNPAIWLIADTDTRIYLFGTVHALRPTVRWRTPAFDRIAREAQELVLEASDEELAGRGPNPVASFLMSKSVPLLERVSPDRRAGLAQMLTEMHVPEGLFDRMETWGVATLLGFAAVGRDWVTESSIIDARATAGVEFVLMREFRANGRPILGAESTVEIISGFRGMSLTEQRAMLDEAVDAWLNRRTVGEPWEGGWLAGDLGRIATIVTAIPPRLYDRLIARRNRGFADWVVRRLERPGTVLFAVGVGHVAGPDAVQTMLEGRGLRVQRIQ